MNRRFLWLLISILLLKSLFIAIDPYPGLMFGDSASYLGTAITKWIPPDRSFIYGFILRRLTLNFGIHSLMPVVLFQAFLSGIASWLVAVCLVKFFRARFSVAVVFSFLCAIEPMQLLFERFVLPDSLATSLFAVFMLAVFSYLKRPGFVLLACIQVISTLLAGLRLNFLPVAIVASILLPVLAHAFRRDWRTVGRIVFIPVVFSVLCSQGLLLGYRALYGRLIEKPPAYSYSDGSFLLSVVVPLVKPVDFPAGVDGPAILKQVRYPMSDPQMRPSHHWMEGGLCDVFQKVIGDSDNANALMKETAIHAGLREPVGVAKLAAGLYMEFFNRDTLRETLKIEQGQNHEPTPEQTSVLSNTFGFDTRNMHFESLTKTWHGTVLPWYWLLLVFPAFYLPYLVIFRRAIGPQHIICAVFALMIVLETVTLVERIVTRYLVPEAWLVFVIVGAMVPTKSSSRTANGTAEGV